MGLLLCCAVLCVVCLSVIISLFAGLFVLCVFFDKDTMTTFSGKFVSHCIDDSVVARGDANDKWYFRTNVKIMGACV